MDVLERLNTLNLPDDKLLNIKQVAEILGLTRKRVQIFAKPKNPMTRSRLKAHFNELHQAYEVRVGDLREFIVTDYAHAKPGRRKMPRAEQQEERDRV